MKTPKVQALVCIVHLYVTLHKKMAFAFGLDITVLQYFKLVLEVTNTGRL